MHLQLSTTAVAFHTESSVVKIDNDLKYDSRARDRTWPKRPAFVIRRKTVGGGKLARVIQGRFRGDLPKGDQMRAIYNFRGRFADNLPRMPDSRAGPFPHSRDIRVLWRFPLSESAGSCAAANGWTNWHATILRERNFRIFHAARNWLHSVHDIQTGVLCALASRVSVCSVTFLPNKPGEVLRGRNA